MPVELTPEIAAQLKRIEELRKLKAAKEAKKKRKVLDRARKDYKAFVEYVLKDEKTGKGIHLHDIHEQWITHIDYCWANNKHPAILAPFGHGKTMICAVGLPLFMLGIDRTLRIKIVCSNDDLACDRLGLVRRYIEDSEEYHEVFPDIRPSVVQKWNAHKAYLARGTLAKDPSLHAVGVGSTAIGARADLIIFDDVNDKRNTIINPKMRESIWSNYRTMMSRLEPVTRLVFIGTRWHEEDTVGMIMKDDDMRQKYGFLIQRVSDDYESIISEYYYGAPDEKTNEGNDINVLLRLRADGVL